MVTTAMASLLLQSVVAPDRLAGTLTPWVTAPQQNRGPCADRPGRTASMTSSAGRGRAKSTRRVGPLGKVYAEAGEAIGVAVRPGDSAAASTFGDREAPLPSGPWRLRACPRTSGGPVRP